MRLYPKVISVISRDIVQLLMKDGDVEVEPMRIADAEMDLSAIMREYLTNEDRVNQAPRVRRQQAQPGEARDGGCPRLQDERRGCRVHHQPDD
jgi:hypothetical protein